MIRLTNVYPQVQVVRHCQLSAVDGPRGLSHGPCRVSETRRPSLEFLTRTRLERRECFVEAEIHTRRAG